MPANLTRIPPDYREALVRWLDSAFTFDLLVTLTTHDSSLGRDRLRDLAREWDARMNRLLYGPKWRQHSDELLWAFAFLEKPEANPHWHLLIRRVEPDQRKWDEQVRKIDYKAIDIWRKIVPSGHADVRMLNHSQSRLIDYLAKEIGREIQCEDFITPDEFRRG
jgi:hypothetical protein